MKKAIACISINWRIMRRSEMNGLKNAAKIAGFVLLLFSFFYVAALPSSSYSIDFVQKVGTSSQEKLIQIARSYYGTPYKWGGMTRKGMDCSALLKLSFARLGYAFPRTSMEQARLGKRVGVRRLRLSLIHI